MAIGYTRNTSRNQCVSGNHKAKTVISVSGQVAFYMQMIIIIYNVATFITRAA
jgi:hypothetical protein